MTSFVVYKRMSRDEMFKTAEQVTKDLIQWFVANPKRRTCNAQLWYGDTVKVRRNHVDIDVQAALAYRLKELDDANTVTGKPIC